MNFIKSYRFQNNLIGWLVWVIATVVFVTTAEKSGSWWDCGEYISTSTKLMVGHPPGAPTFQLLGAIAALFVGRDPAQMGHAVNIVSALCSSFSILFLFWTITMIAKMLLLAIYRQKDTALAACSIKAFNPSGLARILIFGAGIIGGLAYTFSDSFWFSAVEGEVYAMSSFFTAITFWAILKWNFAADEPHHLRWLIFIAFLIGLAIGVHLLNLLVIPAMVFTIYYRKFKPTKKGFWYALLISVVLLAGVLWGIVPWTVKMAGYTELLFVNGFGLPFNSGTFFYLVLLVGLLVWGLVYSIRRQKAVLNTALLCLTFLLIGYSTFITLVVRANADVPINQGENKDAISLLAYLNRDQYGSTPLFYGQYYNAPVRAVEPKNPQYNRDIENHRYVQAGYSSQKVTYDPAFCGLFPRIWSSMESGGRPCKTYNKIWSGCSDDKRPSLGENMRFFIRYQLNWMYFRYFMWNFVGRQNDLMGRCYNIDGTRDVFQGNWLSGIKFIDEWRLGPQDNLPDYLAKNPARNTFYFLPLILGLIGLWFQYKHDRRNCFIVFLLFFMTGVAIAIYLNQPSTEPRERDYAFAASFYAFAIWIGLGTTALGHWLTSRLKSSAAAKTVACAIVAASLVVPGVMAQQGWDDHNRGERTSARDFARNMLESCAPNAVLICDGDNDTFPLWYCQQVEGIRTDVRVINSMLAHSSWLIQPLFRQAYRSAPLKFSLPHQAYDDGSNDAVFVQDNLKEAAYLPLLLQFVAHDAPNTKLKAMSGEWYNYMPTKQVYITKPSAEYLASTGLYTPEEIAAMPDTLSWTIERDNLTKSNLVILDIVANNLYDRPIYCTSPYAHQSYIPIGQAQMEGTIYRWVPYTNYASRAVLGERLNGMDTKRSYGLFTEKFDWGSIPTDMAIDPETRSWSMQVRQQHSILATALWQEGRRAEAVTILDKGLACFPDSTIGFDTDMLRYMQLYYALGEHQKGNAIAQRLTEIFEKRLRYAESFPYRFQNSVEGERQQSTQVLQRIESIKNVYAPKEPIAAAAMTNAPAAAAPAAPNQK